MIILSWTKTIVYIIYPNAGSHKNISTYFNCLLLYNLTTRQAFTVNNGIIALQYY